VEQEASFVTFQAQSIGPALPSEVIDDVVARFRAVLEEYAARVPQSGEELLDLEQGLHQAVARHCLDPIVGALIVQAHKSEVVQLRAELVRGSVPYLKLQDKKQTVNLVLLGGTILQVVTPYYLQRGPREPGRPRGRGKRGKAGHGMYPYLEVLGLAHRVSPAVASEVARLVASGTVDDAREALRLRGLHVNRKQITRVYRDVARRGLLYRGWLEAVAEGHERCIVRMAEGKRLAIGVDGGRIRTRETRRGRPRKNGWRGFEAPWREPKVLVIYEIDERGRRVKKGLLRYDATLQDADGLFRILRAILFSIGAGLAAQWVVVGDGADWIWSRIDELIEALNYQRSRVIEVVDFYHAVQHLHAIADCRKWRKPEHEKWVRTMRRHLSNGDVDTVLAAAEELCVGRRAGDIRKLMDYFETHRLRMRYDVFKRSGIPSGSGAVESAIRRIVNLRLKGNGIFWSDENAEAVLQLRSQLLAGRWGWFMRIALSPPSTWSLGTASGLAEVA
jgi:hypothetical protein